MNHTQVTTSEVQSVKGQGFLYNRGLDTFSARIITENGVLTAEEMQVVAQAARQFGNGNIALTVRLTLELQGIPFEKIPEFTAFIQANGLKTGGTGAKVRPVVACKGTTCSNGLCDTLALGTSIHNRFYEGMRAVTLPHKFKIAVGGCPNNCVKPDLNDIGIVAVQPPEFTLENCKACGKCTVVQKCPLHALSLENGKLAIDASRCNSCGACVEQCHFSVVKSSGTLYKVYVGGKWGKKTRNGSLLQGNFTQQQALDMIEKAILYFKKNAKPGERFGDAIDRIGLEYTFEQLNSDSLLQQKEQILGTAMQDKTTC